MNYPYIVGCGKVPEFRTDSQNNQYQTEMHEYLIVTDADGIEASETQMKTTVASRHLLGFIDLTTGEREDALTNLIWDLSEAEIHNDAYQKLLQPLTMYHVKCLPPVRPWYKTPVKRTGMLYLTEIIQPVKTDPFLESLIQKYTDSLHLHSDLFGELDSSEEYPAYLGTFSWLGTEVKIIVSAEFTPVSKTLAHMAHFCRMREFHDKELREFAAEQLVDKANEMMQSRFTKEELAAGLVIRIIDMMLDGSYYVDFLFHDHLIYINGNLNGPKEAFIHKYDPEYDDYIGQA